MADRTARLLVEVDVESRTAIGEIEAMQAAFGTLPPALEDAQTELDSFDSKMDGLTAVLEDFGVTAESVGAKVAAGQKVQQYELDTLTEKYGAVKSAIDGAFPEGAPAALTSSMKVAEAQIATLEGTIKKLPPALETVTNAANELPPAVVAAFKRAENAVSEFQRKLATDATIGSGEVNRLTTAQVLLNRELERAGLDVTKMGNDAQVAYRKLEVAQKDAVAVTRDMKDALGDVRDEIGANTAGFSGFGNALEQMGGKAGAAAEKFGLITGALAAGIAMGQQFNQFAKTDMSEWDDQMSLLAIRAKELGEAFGELWLGQLQIMKGAATLNWDSIKAGWSSLTDGVNSLKDATTASNDELRKKRDALKLAAAAAKENEDAAKKLADEEKKSADAAKKLAEEKKKLAEDIGKVTESINEETAALEAQKRASTDAFNQESDATGQLQNTTGRVKQLEQTLAELESRWKAAVDSYGENSAAAKNLAVEMGATAAQLDAARARMETLTESVDRYRDAQADAEKATKAHEDKLAKLNEEMLKLGGVTTGAAAAQRDAGSAAEYYAFQTEESSVATTTASDVATGFKTVMRGVDDGLGNLSIRQESVRMTADELAEAHKRAAAATEDRTAKEKTGLEALKEVKDTIEALAKVDMATLTKTVSDQTQGFRDMAAAAREARMEVEKLAKAGSESGDTDDGISIRRTGSDVELGDGDRLTGGNLRGGAN